MQRVKRQNKSKVSNISNLTIEQFNNLYPIGTRVKYWPVRSIKNKFVKTQTTSPAWALGGGTKVVCLEIGAGGYCFDNIAVME